MLGVLRDFERALCVAHSSAEMAKFDHGKHHPHPVHHGRNYAQVVAVLTELIGGKFQALLEQLGRLPIFPQRVIALCETVEQFSQQDAVVALPREASSGLTKLDGTTLLADPEMVSASECGVCALRSLSPRQARMGSSSSKQRPIWSISPCASRALRSPKRRSTACLRLSGLSGNFLRTVNGRSKKRAAFAFA